MSLSSLLRSSQNELTEHFSLIEFTRSSTAERLGIDNTPTEDVLQNLEYTAQCLEKIRKAWGKPIVITSGYRCEKLNKAVGGVSNSQHCKGQAVDIKWDLELFSFILQFCDFDQLIKEKSGKTRWIHISFSKNGNRRKAIEISK